MRNKVLAICLAAAMVNGLRLNGMSDPVGHSSRATYTRISGALSTENSQSTCSTSLHTHTRRHTWALRRACPSLAALVKSNPEMLENEPTKSEMANYRPRQVPNIGSYRAHICRMCDHKLRCVKCGKKMEMCENIVFGIYDCYDENMLRRNWRTTTNHRAHT